MTHKQLFQRSHLTQCNGRGNRTAEDDRCQDWLRFIGRQLTGDESHNPDCGYQYSSLDRRITCSHRASVSLAT